MKGSVVETKRSCPTCVTSKPLSEFSEGHTEYKELICNWCGHMWVHDCH